MGMNILEQLLGGGQQRQEYQDFTRRYDDGPPWQGISDQEAYNRFQQVGPQLPPDMYQQSAQQAFERLTPQQRMQLGQYLQQQAQQQSIAFPLRGGTDAFHDSGYLAQLTGQMHQQQPGILGQLLGSTLGGGGASGGGQGMLESPIAKAALAGIAAVAVKQMMGNR
ncbi:MAG: hypothetical protein M3336_16930 [Chloroflexota bacterium]|nr:hypothetical protein [Chloroflexota bacterium]